MSHFNNWYAVIYTSDWSSILARKQLAHLVSLDIMSSPWNFNEIRTKQNNSLAILKTGKSEVISTHMIQTKDNLCT